MSLLTRSRSYTLRSRTTGAVTENLPRLSPIVSDSELSPPGYSSGEGRRAHSDSEARPRRTYSDVVASRLPTPIDNGVVGELLTPVPNSAVGENQTPAMNGSVVGVSSSDRNLKLPTPAQRDRAVDRDSNLSTLSSESDVPDDELGGAWTTVQRRRTHGPRKDKTSSRDKLNKSRFITKCRDPVVEHATRRLTAAQQENISRRYKN